MNDAVYKFKRYEDSSLEYAGINKHITENKIFKAQRYLKSNVLLIVHIGLWSMMM